MTLTDAFMLLSLLIIPLIANAQTDNLITLDPVNNFVEVEVKAGEEFLIKPTNITNGTSFSIIQANAYLENITLSYNQTLSRGFYTTGINIGLVILNEGTKATVYLKNLNSIPVHVLVGLQVYDSNAPIPGGCNMVQSVQTAPFLPTTYNLWTLDVEYPPASWPLDVGAPICDGGRLQYDIYHLHLPESDISRKTLFDNLRLMSAWKSIERHGKKVVYTGQPISRIEFANYIGTGSIVAIIVRGLTSCAAYVPTTSFGCTIASDFAPCNLFNSTLDKILGACLLFLGLFLAFFGHRFFKYQVFLLGFCLTAILTCIVILLLLSSTVNLPVSVILVGLVGGLILLSLWAYFGAPVLPVFLGCIVLGILFSSIVTYTPLVDLNLFRDNLTFWLGFTCIVLLSPLVLISFPVIASIVVTGFVGSYLFVFPLDQYVGSNLKFIILNFLRRATDPTFGSAIIDPPFQTPDLVFAIVWLLLALGGIAFQIRRERNHERAPFPPPPSWPAWLTWTKLRTISFRQQSTAPTEATPLLA